MDLYRTNLDCGAKFIGVPYKDGERTISAGIAIPRGSMHDPPHLRGAHHFLEHLIYKSDIQSEHHNDHRVKIVRDIEINAGDASASTDYRITRVHCTVGLDDANLFFKYLTTLTLSEPVFSPHELGLERKVVFEEIGKYHDDPSSLALDMAQTIMYKPPFGGMVLGTKKSLERITSKEIRDLWKNGYIPQDIVVFVVGDTNFPRIVDKFNKHFDKFKLNKKSSKFKDPPIELKNPNNYLEVREGLDQAHLVFTLPAPHTTSKDSEVFDQVINYLTWGSISYLYKEIRELRGFAYDPGGFAIKGDNYSHGGMYVDTNYKNVPKAVNIIQDGFIAAKNISKKDFEAHKKRALKHLYQTRLSNCDILDSMIEHELNGSGAESFFTRSKTISDISLGQFRYVAKMASESPRYLVAISPREIKGFDSF